MTPRIGQEKYTGIATIIGSEHHGSRLELELKERPRVGEKFAVPWETFYCELYVRVAAVQFCDNDHCPYHFHLHVEACDKDYVGPVGYQCLIFLPGAADHVDHGMIPHVPEVNSIMGPGDETGKHWRTLEIRRCQSPTCWGEYHCICEEFDPQNTDIYRRSLVAHLN